MAAPLNILHVLRAPVGGLFRHVCDLARGQAARGHQVGVVADADRRRARRRGARRPRRGARARPHPRPDDAATSAPATSRRSATSASARRRTASTSCTATAPRAAPMRGWRGGRRRSAGLHAARRQPALPLGHARRAASISPPRRMLRRRTDLFLFESYYGRDTFAAKIGDPPHGAGARRAQRRRRCRVPAGQDRAGRDRSGFRRRVAQAQGRRRADRGDGAACARRPQRHRDDRRRRRRPRRVRSRRRRAQSRATRSASSAPSRRAPPSRSAALLVVPSRAESLPYIVLEAAAAGLADHRHQCRRHPRDLRAGRRRAGSARRSGGAGRRHRAAPCRTAARGTRRRCGSNRGCAPRSRSTP